MKYFLEIASGRTYWDIAESHNISQSSVSKAIQKLENELGVKLFDRSKRSVSLTPAGSIFFETLRQLEPEFRNALERMSLPAAKCKIVCGIVPSLDFLDLRLKIQGIRFEETYPGIDLSLAAYADPIQAALHLKEEKVDFIIGHQFRSTIPFCDAVPVFEDTFYAVLSKGHPLSNQTYIDFADLYNETFLIRSLVIKEALRDSCEAINRPMVPHCHIFNISSDQLSRNHIISRVAFGHGITLYFESDLYPFKLDNVCVRPLTNCPTFPVKLAWKKGRTLSSTQQLFRTFICEHIFTPDVGFPCEDNCCSQIQIDP